MLCVGAKKAYFVVYTFKGLLVIYIPCDDGFIADMISKLGHFFEQHFKEVLLENGFGENEVE